MFPTKIHHFTICRNIVREKRTAFFQFIFPGSLVTIETPVKGTRAVVPACFPSQPLQNAGFHAEKWCTSESSYEPPQVIAMNKTHAQTLWDQRKQSVPAFSRRYAVFLVVFSSLQNESENQVVCEKKFSSSKTIRTRKTRANGIEYFSNNFEYG